MSCSPNRVATIWQEQVQYTFVPGRLQEFLKRDEIASLRRFDPDELVAAAKRAQDANKSGHLLLDEWLSCVWELKIEQKAVLVREQFESQRSPAPKQKARRPRQKERTRRSQGAVYTTESDVDPTEAEQKARRLTQNVRASRSEREVDPTDYQLHANKRRWNGPRRPWEPM